MLVQCVVSFKMNILIKILAYYSPQTLRTAYIVDFFGHWHFLSHLLWPAVRVTF